ncbi:MAG: TetR/AcrR family transcriptional regulator [Marmoricola sp.]
MTPPPESERRSPLNRDKVLRAAVRLADTEGIESVSMRRLSHDLGVVPMALYKHVANKDELVGGMVDVVVGEIAAPAEGLGWKPAVRHRVLSAREVMLGHPWASRVIEARTTPTPVVLAYMDSTIALFLDGGLSIDLTHHVMHALGPRMFGFTQELFTDPAAAGLDPAVQAVMLEQIRDVFPHVVTIATGAAHDAGTVVGPGCDDQFEFEFGIDLLLDGFERLHQAGWTSR